MRKNLNKGISTPVGIIIIILVAVIVGGGILVWQQRLIGKNLIPTPTPEISILPTQTPDETSGWKTYKDDYYGYEFKYPPAPAGCTDECSIVSPTYDYGFYMNTVSLKIENSDGLVLPAFVDRWVEYTTRDGYSTIESRKDKIIGGENSIYITYRFGGMNKYGEIAFIEKDNHVFEFYFVAGEFCCSPTTSGGIYDADFFNAVLSTFKFVDETTEVIKYIPTEIPSEIKEGHCWVNSISVPRKGAWRCMIESSISDPCFVISGSEDLVCDVNPITGDGGFLLKLTEPLPEDTATDNYGQGWGWLIQLEDGTVCGFITGATGAINGERINYGCSDNSYIIGGLEVGTIWKAKKVDDLQTKSIEVVPVKKVWQ